MSGDFREMMVDDGILKRLIQHSDGSLLDVQLSKHLMIGNIGKYMCAGMRESD